MISLTVEPLLIIVVGQFLKTFNIDDNYYSL